MFKIVFSNDGIIHYHLILMVKNKAEVSHCLLSKKCFLTIQAAVWLGNVTAIRPLHCKMERCIIC